MLVAAPSPPTVALSPAATSSTHHTTPRGVEGDQTRPTLSYFSKSAMEKALPRPAAGTRFRPGTRGFPTRRTLLGLIPAIGCFLVIWYGFAFGQGIKFWEAYTSDRLSLQAATAVARCANLHDKPGPPPNFLKRSQSDRYVPGTKPVLLKNAKIWSGEKNGTEVLHADVLLDKGVIRSIGRTSLKLANNLKEEYEVIDVRGAWVTPGYVGSTRDSVSLI